MRRQRLIILHGDGLWHQSFTGDRELVKSGYLISILGNGLSFIYDFTGTNKKWPLKFHLFCKIVYISFCLYD